MLETAKRLVRRDITKVFAAPVEETFYRIASPLLKYLFLRACHEADRPGIGLRNAEFTDKSIDNVLLELGLASTVAKRRELLEGLEVHALCAAEGTQRSRQKVASPIVYEYVREAEHDLSSLLDALRRDIELGYGAVDHFGNRTERAG